MNSSIGQVVHLLGNVGLMIPEIKEIHLHFNCLDTQLVLHINKQRAQTAVILINVGKFLGLGSDA